MRTSTQKIKTTQMGKEIISLREFGRRMKIGEKTIRDAIKSKKIEKGVTEVNGKPKIIYQVAKLEYEAFNIGAKAKYGVEEETPDIAPGQKKDDAVSEDYLKGDAPIGRAQRMKAIAEANIKLREEALLAGSLVKVEDLKNQLCELMSSIRIEFETLPNRAAGKIFNSNKDLNTITEILAKEIRRSIINVNNKCSINKVMQDEDN